MIVAKKKICKLCKEEFYQGCLINVPGVCKRCQFPEKEESATKEKVSFEECCRKLDELAGKVELLAEKDKEPFTMQVEKTAQILSRPVVDYFTLMIADQLLDEALADIRILDKKNIN